MKRISGFIIFSVVLFALSFTLVHAQKRPTTKTPKAQPVNKTASKPSYDSGAFDPSLEKLSPQYLGHDPEIIFSALLGRKDNAEKGEYETTEAFQLRLHRLRSAPLVGGLSVNSIFAFKGKDVETSYDANKGVLNVAIVLEKIIEGGTKPLVNYEKSGSLDSPNRSVVLKDRLESRKYPAINAFGAKTIVQELSSDDFLIEINNWSSFRPAKYFPEGAGRDIYNRDLASGNRSLIEASTALFSREAFVIPLSVDPSTAARIRRNLKALFICRLREPFVAASSRDTDATISKPTSYKMRYYYLNVDVVQILIYDSSNGVVFERFPKSVVSRKRGPSPLDLSSAEKEIIVKRLRSDPALRLAIGEYLVKLDAMIYDFPKPEGESISVNDPKNLASRTNMLIKESLSLAALLPEGDFRTHVGTTGIGFGQALAMRVEAEGVRNLSQKIRKKSSGFIVSEVFLNFKGPWRF